MMVIAQWPADHKTSSNKLKINFLLNILLIELRLPFVWPGHLGDLHSLTQQTVFCNE